MSGFQDFVGSNSACAGINPTMQLVNQLDKEGLHKVSLQFEKQIIKFKILYYYYSKIIIIYYKIYILRENFLSKEWYVVFLNIIMYILKKIEKRNIILNN